LTETKKPREKPAIPRKRNLLFQTDDDLSYAQYLKRLRVGEGPL
jgi:hypothetical protein